MSAPAATQAAPKKTFVAPPMPTCMRKKVEANKKFAAALKKHLQKQKVDRIKARQEVVKTTAAHYREYRATENAIISAQRQAKAAGGFYVPDGAKVVCAMRIRGIMEKDPKTRKILQLLRLRQLHNMVFLKVNKPIMTMLNLVEPCVAYGYPNVKTIREVLLKRGYAKVTGQRIPITNNQMIANALGKFGIKSLEDLVHEIFTAGPHFREAVNWLWPVKLTSPRGGFGKKLRHFCEGGAAGNREDYVNELVRRML